jgi:SAM-dependent methyltransferase
LQQEPEATYVLGHSDEEMQRLIALGRLYEPPTAQLFREAGIAPGMRVLGVGSGAGDVALLAARMVGPAGQVVGVDRSPLAVATATHRARAHELTNTRFVEGDAGTLTFDAPFDAAVGRFVLMHCPDPVAVLRQVVAHVRPGGVIAFLEPDWSGFHTSPGLPTWERATGWIIEAQRQAGADLNFGLKLHQAYAAVGLPHPTLSASALIGSGPDHPLYQHCAALVRTLVPALERRGIASADEVDAETLATRLREEVTASDGVVVWLTLIGAVARKPLA